MTPIKTALVGASHPHSSAYLGTLQVSSLVSSIVVCEEDSVALEKLLRNGTEKIAGTCNSFSSLLQSGDISFGIAALPTDLNALLCERFLKAGVHVFSEKPVAKTAHQIEKLISIAGRNDRQLGVAYCTRIHPAALKARCMIQENVIGRVTSIEARFITSQVRHRDPKHWLFSRQRSGGGILSWLGCHYLDLMRFVLEDEVINVSMLADTFYGEDIDVEDVASLTLQFGKGAIGSLQLGYQLAVSQSGYINGSYDGYFCIRGEDGQINCDLYSNPPVIQAESITSDWGESHRRHFEFDLQETEGYGGSIGLSTIEQFIRSLDGNGEPVATGQDALKVARIIEAAYESNRISCRVSL